MNHYPLNGNDLIRKVEGINETASAIEGIQVSLWSLAKVAMGDKIDRDF